MNSSVVPFKPEHLSGLDDDTLNQLGLTSDWISLAGSFEKHGTAYSLFADGCFIACAGVNKLHPGVGEAWAVITPKAKKYQLSLHRAATKCLNAIIKKQGFHRVQATVINNFPKGELWLKHLGFAVEGLMRSYNSNKEDYWLYARVVK